MRNKKNELVFIKSITTISWVTPSFFMVMTTSVVGNQQPFTDRQMDERHILFAAVRELLDRTNPVVLIFDRRGYPPRSQGWSANFSPCSITSGPYQNISRNCVDSLTCFYRITCSLYSYSVKHQKSATA